MATVTTVIEEKCFLVTGMHFDYHNDFKGDSYLNSIRVLRSVNYT